MHALITSLVAFAFGFIGSMPLTGPVAVVVVSRAGQRSMSSSFLLGFSISAMNPTLLATWSAATAVLYSRQLVTFTPLLALPFGLSAGAGVACWEVLLVALVRRFEDRFPRRALTRIVHGMGLLLIAVALWSAVDLIRTIVDKKL